jgi:hypothetical protein
MARIDLIKLKWILRLITVCCIVTPLVVVAAINSNNLLGLVVPPQVEKLINNANSIGSSNGVQSNGNNDINSTLLQLGVNPDKLQAPQIEQLTYNNETGIADLIISFANPMENTALDVKQFSVDVADSKGTPLFTIQLDKAIDIGAGQTGDISLSGNALNDNAKVIMGNLINGNNTQSLNIDNFKLSNLNADVGGISIHVENVDSQNLLSGFLGGS